MLKVTTQYPIIDNGKVIENGERCLNECSKEEPFLYQPTEYSNADGKEARKVDTSTLGAVLIIGILTGIVSNYIFFKYVER